MPSASSPNGCRAHLAFLCIRMCLQTVFYFIFAVFFVVNSSFKNEDAAHGREGQSRMARAAGLHHHHPTSPCLQYISFSLVSPSFSLLFLILFLASSFHFRHISSLFLLTALSLGYHVSSSSYVFSSYI